jgi:PKD repeat protein
LVFVYVAPRSSVTVRSTSSERNPVHTYATKGRFDVLLTVTDDRGATDTKTKRADAKD